MIYNWMKYLKNFKLFESEGSSLLTSEMESLINDMMSEITIVVETDKDEMLSWVVERGLKKVTDEYLESDEFREFTKASVEETDEYRERVQSGEDPDEVLKEMTNEAVEDQKYWEEFLENTGYDTDAFDEIREKVPYVDFKKKKYLYQVKSTWKEVPGSSFPTIDIEGSAVLYKYEGSFLPFRIREVTSGDLLPSNIIKDFQTSSQEDISGELSVQHTRLIAWDKPTSVEVSFYIADNPRLISIEGVGETYDHIEISDNLLDEEILKKSIGLTPGSRESLEYYLSLLDLPESKQFDEEQLSFIISRIGDLQSLIDENPERMAIVLTPILKKLKTMKEYKDLQWPKGLSGEVDILSDLNDVGL